MVAIEGANDEIDTHALEKTARYDGGYTAQHPYIKAFWTVVHAWPQERKRKFLLFTTGTDRIPMGGAGQLGLILQRNGPDTERLPTASTCYSALPTLLSAPLSDDLPSLVISTSSSSNRIQISSSSPSTSLRRRCSTSSRRPLSSIRASVSANSP